MNLKSILKKRIDDHSDANLLFENLSDVFEMDRNFASEMIQAKTDETKKKELIDYVTNYCLKTFYGINQYLSVNHEDELALRKIYQNTWDNINHENQEQVLSQHYEQLAHWLKRKYSDDFVYALQKQQKIGRVVNQEYSAEIQLQILGLDLHSIVEPVLDLGCGSNGNLVRYLRDCGIEAFGIDRMVDVDAEYLNKQSWFDYPFEKNHWGTIVSNMAFTNHVRYALANEVEKLDELLSVFERLLKALVVGGRMIYAPGVEMLEALADADQFEIHRKEIFSNLFCVELIKLW